MDKMLSDAEIQLDEEIIKRKELGLYIICIYIYILVNIYCSYIYIIFLN